MNKHICTVCDWIYDPISGDPDNGIPAGTAFDEIIEINPDWKCPKCVQGVDVFEAITD